MRTVFADTGYWIALLDPQDTLHHNAVNLSITDCASFCIMQQQGIQEALAYDRHFEQAGFIALLR